MQDEVSRPGADADDVQRFMLARAQRGVQSGPFSIILSRGDAGPYGNYAIPALGAAPTPAEITDLEEVFRSRGRMPRLEYVPAAAPAVEAALAAAGFEVELWPPLMTRRAGAAQAQPFAGGFAPSFVEGAGADLDAAVAVQAAALDGDEAAARWMADVPARGGRLLLAREAATGAPAGVGATLGPLDGITEVVGIGVAPAFRRSGLGQAITAHLAETAFDAGCTLVFLTAAGEPQAAIYERAGFTRQPPMLFISKR